VITGKRIAKEGDKQKNSDGNLTSRSSRKTTNRRKPITDNYGIGKNILKKTVVSYCDRERLFQTRKISR
jgi:hypothetical protein